MFRDIVVPLDGSGFAEGALDLAQRIASECGARIHLIRVFRPGADRPAAQDSAMRAADKRYLESFVAELRDTVPDVCVAVIDGSAGLAIADYADRVSADLIVMTTHGRTGDERRRLGSVASVIAHHARCTVMLMRVNAAGPEGESTAFDRILIAVDGTECRGDVEALALWLGTVGHATFTIVHTVKPVEAPELVAAKANMEMPFGCIRPQRAKAEGNTSCIVGRLHAAGLRANGLITVAQQRADAILTLAHENAADLVVLTAPALTTTHGAMSAPGTHGNAARTA